MSGVLGRIRRRLGSTVTKQSVENDLPEYVATPALGAGLWVPHSACSAVVHSTSSKNEEDEIDLVRAKCRPQVVVRAGAMPWFSCATCVPADGSYDAKSSARGPG